ncbi:DUF952 domain-containing protein [Hyphococcus lacteus]|uniref:DUF952 domain-containing protein n=1 Tax=Hyphococcus lacteus TaxID=3143536 RepID=A0ABV3Z2R8_9PROT
MVHNQATAPVFRLATLDEWNSAQVNGLVPEREIDTRDGYMHLSTRDQALETANIHFKGVKDLLLLEIPAAPIAKFLKYELAPKRGDAFPHLYSSLRVTDVERAVRLIETGNGFEFGEPL